MTPDRYRQVVDLFEAASELAPNRRDQLLAESCAADPELRAEVESLLAAHEKTGRFIDEPPFEAAARAFEWREAKARAGQTIGRYRIVLLLGKGGMSEVYLADDTQLDRHVALKLLPAESTSDDTRVRRFVQEAKAASALNHPNIITVYEIGQDAGTHFMATEFVEGQTLREQIQEAQLELAEVLDIAIQVTAALAAAHAAGIIHRDIKPENIMRRPDGLVKVLDFGIAKLIAGRSAQTGGEAAAQAYNITAPGVILGTPEYLSPERARLLPVDARTDIFSLGVVLYEMLTGRTPFEGWTVNDVIAALLTAEPAPLTTARPETPAELQRIVSRALHKNPAERYQSCEELLADLKSLKQQFATRVVTRTVVVKLADAGVMQAEPNGEPAAPGLSWRQALVVLLVGLAAGLGAAIVWWWLARRR